MIIKSKCFLYKVRLLCIFGFRETSNDNPANLESTAAQGDQRRTQSFEMRNQREPSTGNSRPKKKRTLILIISMAVVILALVGVIVVMSIGRDEKISLAGKGR